MVSVTYEQLSSDVAKWIEAVGAGIMVGGGLLALCKYVLSMLQPGDPRDRYRQFRRQLGQASLLGLQVPMVGDMVRTIIVDPTVRSVGVLGMRVGYRLHPDRSQLLAGGGDQRGLAVEPVAVRRAPGREGGPPA